MVLITREKELEFIKRAQYKLTPLINPAELEILKANGAFNMLVQAYVLGMADMFVELQRKIEKYENELRTLDSSMMKEEDESEQHILPLWPIGTKPQ